MACICDSAWDRGPWVAGAPVPTEPESGNCQLIVPQYPVAKLISEEGKRSCSVIVSLGKLKHSLHDTAPLHRIRLRLGLGLKSYPCRGSFPFPVFFPQCPSSFSWEHFFSKSLAQGSLSYCLLGTCCAVPFTCTPLHILLLLHIFFYMCYAFYMGYITCDIPFIYTV